MNYPGIPPLLNQPTQAVPPLLSADTATLPVQYGSAAQWGIYQNSAPVILADNVVAFDYKKDWRISNYPQEEGAFQSYNKVTMPYDARITMTKGGTISDRQDFLDQINAVAASFDLYDVVTPEIIFKSANVSHVDYSRTSTNGVGLLTVDIWLTEIRVTATQQFSNTKNPNSTDPATPGAVQVQTPTPAETTKLNYNFGISSGGGW
jgi:hypothetical protein